MVIGHSASMRILAIETSCDETSAAVCEGDGDSVRILSNVVGSQIATHERYGGVVPELAARRHAEMIIPIVKKALALCVDAIAVTYGPGLMVSLTVGVETAKALSYASGLPIIGVNHIEGHIYSVLAGGVVSYGKNAESELTARFFSTPALALIVSGGDTGRMNISEELETMRPARRLIKLQKCLGFHTQGDLKFQNWRKADGATLTIFRAQ